MSPRSSQTENLLVPPQAWSPRIRRTASIIMRSSNGSRVSVALILSYIFDWVIIIGAAAVGSAFSLITPFKRPFSLGNPDISFPYTVHEKVSTATLIVASLVAPAVIIIIVAFLFVPGPTVPKSTPKALIWKRKLWEWFTGWMGLGLSLAGTWLITNGMKNLFGKPRPDLLARCLPDIANLATYAVNGFPITPDNSMLVYASICKQTDNSLLNDGFRSFPSGHASWSAAGLVYLSLFLASKLAITIPFLAPRAYSREISQFSAFPSHLDHHRQTRFRNSQPSADSAKGEPSAQLDPYHLPTGNNDAQIAARNQAAAPPVYLLIFAFIPTAVAIYISSTRFADFRHHGFDILFGFTIGLVMAVFSFRYYHLPITQGAGWSWGPRSRNRAFWSGIGRGTYVSAEDDEEEELQMTGGMELQDLEAGGPSNAAVDRRMTPNGIGQAVSS